MSQVPKNIYIKIYGLRHVCPLANSKIGKNININICNNSKVKYHGEKNYLEKNYFIFRGTEVFFY